jgi:hypothetical protein
MQLFLIIKKFLGLTANTRIKTTTVSTVALHALSVLKAISLSAMRILLNISPPQMNFDMDLTQSFASLKIILNVKLPLEKYKR